MKKIPCFIIIILSLSACGRFSNKEKNVEQDQRIVCVSQQLNEIIFALGKGKELVAVDLSSTYPDSAGLLPTVGYHRLLSAEGIISMKPDLVLHDNNIGPASVMPQLQKAGVNIKDYSGGNSVDSTKMLIRELGNFFKAGPTADSIIRKMDEDLMQANSLLSSVKIKDTPSVMVIQFGRANNTYFIMSGRGGTVDKMIEMAGAKVSSYNAKNSRQISAEAVAIANPGIIIATDFGFDKMGSAEKFATIPGVALTDAAKNNRIYRFLEHDLVYFGPRTGINVIQLMKLFYPSADVSKK